jgi:hypothetical protein
MQVLNKASVFVAHAPKTSNIRRYAPAVLNPGYASIICMSATLFVRS